MPDILSLFSRRFLLFGVGAAAVGGGAMKFASTEQFSLLLRPRGKGRKGVPLATAARDDWTAQVGTFFTADTGQVLELTDVQGFHTHGERPKHLRESAFVARFEIKDGGAMLDGQLRRVAHPNGGTFDMFLTAGSDPARMLAVFN